ncbi:hypothetical protein IAQ61_010434 [Plenodomus lingam]|uniref:uncharacterized protein n=1 Tax=Leptosphaeria maculans TaxID=5022 RepID=UPI00331CD286|nr:hypothetical protein IAQ61_010434 [Plenodomus lingam]
MIRIHQSISRVLGQQSARVVNFAQRRSATTNHSRGAGRKSGAWSNWPSEKLQINDQYPLTKALSAVIHPSKEVGTSRPETVSYKRRDNAVHVRSQIVSPNLCDDVIKYIGSTLEKHKGCDIIDINPGAGLWSQKLHDYLKPHSHVLLEPRYDKFKDFLDPLITAPNSTYKLVEKDPCARDTYREIVSEGIFPDQVVRGPREPKAQETNNTLLVTGSLVWDPKLTGLGFDSMAKQLIHHFASSAASNDLFHAFGLIRMLLWVQHEDLSPMVADSISNMYKANRVLEMTQNITLVVNAERTERKIGRGSSGREPQYELESLTQALRRARDNGFEIPTHRRAASYNYALELERLTGGTGIMRSEAMQEFLCKQQMSGNPTTGLLQTTYIDCYEQEKLLAEKYPDIDLSKIVNSGKALKTILKDHPASLEVRNYLKRRNQINSSAKTKVHIEHCADIGEEMHDLEIKALRMKDGKKKDAVIKEIEELDQKWEETLASIPPNHQTSAQNEADERISMRTPPHPRIQWDQRPFEPLVMQDDEVWPQNRLSLVSMEPIPQPFKEDIPDYTEWLNDFIFGLFNAPNDAVDHALDKMQHGLSVVIKDCPSLKDPEKGGRLKMNQLRVRMLTVEMIEELVSAYRKWPFKAPGSDYSKYFRHKSHLGQLNSRRS